MAGRKPTPTSLHVLRGNPSRKRLPKAEPKPAAMPVVPEPPSHLPELAAEEWRRLAGLLDGMNLLTESDLKALETYCTAYHAYRETSEVLADEGYTYETVSRDGSVMNRKRPEWEVCNAAIGVMNRIGAEFGLTPSARVRLDGAGAKPDTENDDDAFMAGTR